MPPPAKPPASTELEVGTDEQYGIPFTLNQIAGQITPLMQVHLSNGTLVPIIDKDGNIIGGGGGGVPSGVAGGDLTGTYPNPSFAVDMATQAELNAHTGSAADVHSQYQLKSAKNAASGYAGLDSGSRISTAQLPTAAALLTDVTAGVAAGIATHVSDTSDMHPQYQKESEKNTGGGYVGTELSTNAQTGTSYTLVLSDALKIVSMSNASPNTLTIPPNASVPFAVGTRILVKQAGTGSTMLAAGAGVTLNTVAGTLTLNGRYAYVTLFKVGGDVWEVAGDVGSPAGLSGIPTNTVTAKGDLIAASAAFTVTRLPVGTNGQVLSANSATATGLQWIAAGGGGGTARGLPANVICPLDYGAVGDGTTNDWAALTACYLAAVAGGYAIDGLGRSYAIGQPLVIADSSIPNLTLTRRTGYGPNGSYMLSVCNQYLPFTAAGGGAGNIVVSASRAGIMAYMAANNELVIFNDPNSVGLPSGLVPGQAYYAVYGDDATHTLRVSATLGGSPIIVGAGGGYAGLEFVSLSRGYIGTLRFNIGGAGSNTSGLAISNSQDGFIHKIRVDMGGSNQIGAYIGGQSNVLDYFVANDPSGAGSIGLLLTGLGHHVGSSIIQGTGKQIQCDASFVTLDHVWAEDGSGNGIGIYISSPARGISVGNMVVAGPMKAMKVDTADAEFSVDVIRGGSPSSVLVDYSAVTPGAILYFGTDAAAEGDVQGVVMGLKKVFGPAGFSIGNRIARTVIGTTATGVNTLNSATINVGSAASFSASGTAYLNGIAFSYTGTTGTSFTGCSGHAATTGGENITTGPAGVRLSDHTVFASGTFSIYLPWTGWTTDPFTVVNIGAGTVTVDRGGATIDGAAANASLVATKYKTLVSRGAGNGSGASTVDDWRTVGGN